MGYMTLFAPCLICGEMFSSNPLHVPSLRSPETGEKEPICSSCLNRANYDRRMAGKKPVVPHPSAYEPEKETSE